MVATACPPVDRCSATPWGADEPSDEELLVLACRGDGASAFESLVHRYEHDLFAYLRRYLGNAEMAEDVFQLTFLQIHLKRECFEAGRRFRPWLYAIATNQAIDAQRRNRRHRMVSLDHPVGDGAAAGTLLQMLAGADQTDPMTYDPTMDPAAVDWVREAVAKLPDPMKMVLTLVYHQGLKYREAADALGLPVGTVKSRLNTAIRRLTQSWRLQRKRAGSGA